MALLAEGLRAAGLDLAAADVAAFAAGVGAAPRPALAAWLDLMDPPLAADLRATFAARVPVPADPGAPADRAGRLAQLRAALAAAGLDGWFVPRADEHQGEYVPPCAQRLAWLTGFTGSAGLAVVLAGRAALFVDGRYTLQARAEVAAERFELRHLLDDPVAAWMAEAVPGGGRIGYDPRLHTFEWAERTGAALAEVDWDLVPWVDNPVDQVWSDRPPPPLAPVLPHPLVHTGRSAAEKRALVAAELQRGRIAAAVLTQPDSIAWLLNIRGGDVPHTPLPLSFAVVRADGGVRLFIDPRKLPPVTLAHLGDQVQVEQPVAFGDALLDLGGDGRRVLADPATASAWVVAQLRAGGARLVRQPDPCQQPKAVKTVVELAGARAAHRRDGLALVRFLAWLDGRAAAGGLTESAAAAELARLRGLDPLCRDSSFETIAAAGPNGAICHYRVTPATDRVLEPDSLFLIDSGGQYPDGTTDVTRTVAVGSPTPDMRRAATLVLRAHIALATVRFPEGTTGSQLDVLARRPLWDHGLDYDHGTGHGVGSYLSVHEGPQRISKLPNKVALQPGMILSNEPGCYVPDRYGIRLENLVAVIPCPNLPMAARPMLAFETLTLAPFDRRLIDVTLLAPEERAWVDGYHERVRAVLAADLEAPVAAWLAAATAPL